MERGTQIHALLEGVDWLEDDNDSPFQSEDSDVARELASCLTEPEIRALLTRPDSEDPCELWKERAFDVLVDGKWLSGVIDRAQIHRAADGSICHVDIIDFKSDRLDSDALSGACEQHSVQFKKLPFGRISLTGPATPSGSFATLFLPASGGYWRLRSKRYEQ